MRAEGQNIIMKKFFSTTAVILSAMLTLSSCGKDKDDEPIVPTPQVQKRLVEYHEDGNAWINQISYDNVGTIDKTSEYYSEYNCVLYSSNYMYSEEQITILEEDYNYTGELESTYTNFYKIESGLIKDYGDYKITYENGRIKSWTDFYDNGYADEIVTFTWQDGDIVSMESSLGIKLEYTYFSEKDFGGVNALQQSNSVLYDDLDPYLVMQGFFGKLPVHLLKSVKRTDSDGDINTYDYTYYFDEDGYPLSMIERLKDNRTFTTSFKWRKQ
ncbi:MAG: hypothetical protein K2M00_00625 [Muribaculaceae bacterium]|nr:hypothetical protein [Muribaculaceae bacterium]